MIAMMIIIAWNITMMTMMRTIVTTISTMLTMMMGRENCCMTIRVMMGLWFRPLGNTRVKHGLRVGCTRGSHQGYSRVTPGRHRGTPGSPLGHTKVTPRLHQGYAQATQGLFPGYTWLTLPGGGTILHTGYSRVAPRGH